MGGPIWNAPLSDKTWVKNAHKLLNQDKDLYASHNRLGGLLTVIEEELDTPFHYDIPHMSNVIRLATPRHVRIKSALINLGYIVTGSHTSANAIKTNAPSHVVWDIMREQAKLTPPKRVNPNAPAARILAKVSQTTADWEERGEKTERVPRFLPNPSPYWGPQQKATGKRQRAEDKGSNGKRGKTSEELAENEPEKQTNDPMDTI